MKRQILGLINRMGERLPKRAQRAIADFPGMLTLLSKMSRGAVDEIITPEGYRVEINPLFHSNLVRNGSLVNYESEMRRAITRLTKPGFTAYDIGANVGIFSFLFLSLVGSRGHVYAFEPEPNNSVCLDNSFRKTGVENISLDRRAVGNDVSITMFDRRGGAFSGRLIGDNVKYSPTDNVMKVKTTTLDKLVYDENYQPPDIMKIDVEGNELMVLLGMARILKEKPPVIICELHSHLGDSVNDVAKILRKNKYRIYEIKKFLELPVDDLVEIISLKNTRHIVAIPA